MKLFRFARSLAIALTVTVAVSSSGCAQAPLTAMKAQSYDLCARGINVDPVKPFTKTLRVKLTVNGPLLDDTVRKPVLAQLILNTVWRDRAGQVFVEPFEEADCTASGDDQSEVTVDITQADIETIKSQVGRGAGVIDQVTEIARRATTKLDFPSSTAEAQKRWLRVFYATNRQPLQTTATAEAYGTQRVDQLSYGKVEVAVLHQQNMKDIESPAIFKFERATNLDNFAAAGNLVPLSRSQWLDELKNRAGKFERPGVLLFVHGYNVTFVDAARRAAQLSYDLAFPGPTVFFAWPSDASLIKYPRDGRDAENSWISAESVISDLSGLLPSGPVYIVAHSMGNRVMLGGLERVLFNSPSSRRAIKQVIMAAPDVDQDSFRLNSAPKIFNTGPRFTLYASERDLTMATAEFLHGGNRLGMGGGSLFVANGIDSIDASAITKEFFALNHSYFGDKTGVLSDIFFLVRQALPPENRPNLRRKSPATPSGWLLQ